MSTPTTTFRRPTDRPADRPFDSTLIVLVGLVPGVVHASHFFDGASSLGTAALGSGPGAVLSVGLVVAGTVSYRRHGVPAPGVWTVGGLVFGLVVATLLSTQQTMAGGTVRDVAYFVAAAGSLGGGAGYAAGYYRARAFRRAVDANVAREGFRELFDGLPNPAVEFVSRDGTPRVRSVNPAFESVFGYDAEAVEDRPLADLAVPLDGSVDGPGTAPDPGTGSPGGPDPGAGSHGDSGTGVFGDRLGGSGPVATEIPYRTADGIRYFDLHAFRRPAPTDGGTAGPGIAPGEAGDLGTPVEDADATAGIAIAIDVTERCRREQRIEVLNRVLRHDLRTEANLVLGYADLLAAGEADRGRVAGEIRSAAEDLVEIGRKSRAVERSLREGRGTADATDVTGVVETAVEEFREEYPHAECSLEAPGTAVARASDLLGVAVTELLENAVEHHDRDDPRVDVDVTADDEGVAVRVADDGPGIPEGERRVFAAGNESALEHASGLGLWLVTWVVEDLDGEVAFADNDPRGSVVTIRLPGA